MIMVWAVTSTEGKTNLAFVHTTFNLAVYGNVSEELLLPFSYFHHDSSFCSIQDNASIHCSRYIKDWSHRLNISFYRSRRTS